MAETMMDATTKSIMALALRGDVERVGENSRIRAGGFRKQMDCRASGDRYTHEFTRDDHIRLLRITTRGLRAMVAICAYRNELYDRALDGWHRTDFKNRSYAGPRTPGRKLPQRVLSVFTNYEPPTR